MWWGILVFILTGMCFDCSFRECIEWLELAAESEVVSTVSSSSSDVNKSWSEVCDVIGDLLEGK